MNSSFQAIRVVLFLGSTLFGASSAFAQAAKTTPDPVSTPPAAPAADELTSEIVVTGTRIIADGYQAPTPLTVVTTEELLKKAPESLSAALTKLPQFVGTAGATVTSAQAGTPSAGNYLNLRRLGQIETLLLLDGQRLPSTSFDGSTDANIIPQALIERVDVVTGGASAAYGSDAVAGVVNFILNKEFTGIKADAHYGIADRGDAEQTKASIAGGALLLNDRLHLMGSFDYFSQPGLKTNDSRPYGGNYEGGWVNVGANPARPCAAGACAANSFTPTFNVRIANGTYGTLINSGRNAAGATVPFTLNNFTFEPTLVGGPVSAFGAHRADLGTPTGTPNYNVGGADTAVTFGTTLTSLLRTNQAFARASYDFGSDVEAFVQGTYTDADTRFVTVGAGTQFGSFQVFSENPYLPTGVRDAMIAEGVRSFVGSRVEADQTPKVALTNNKAFTVLAGVTGRIGEFRWAANLSHGNSALETEHSGNFFQQRWFASLDAVDQGEFQTGTRNGNIVCRTQLTNPGLYPGCAPWNLFGNGSPSEASYAYFEDVHSTYRVENTQNAVSANITGELFALPAGAVNIAFGGEYRRQELEQTSNNDPSVPIDLTGLRTNANPYNLTFNSTNVGKASGKQNIAEGFVEIAVPILRDAPFAKTLDISGAARFVDYSVSGNIWAWKLGGIWSPIEQLRIRATKSRDIRAPTLYELFAGVSSTRGAFADVHTGVNTNVINLTQGNPDLKPELAETFTVGAVWRPSFAPRLSISVDYFRIEIADQITRLSNIDLNQLCEDSGGDDPLCRYVVRPLPFADRTPANFPITISQLPFNQASLTTDGFDYEVGYELPVGSGQFDFRLLGNYTPKLTTLSSPTAIPVLNAGVAGTGLPKHKISASVDWTRGPLNLGFEARYLGEMFYTRNPNVFVTNNRLSPVTYLNANVSYDIKQGDAPVTIYLTGSNLTDKLVFAPQNNVQPTEFYPSFQSQYDVVGRYFVLGARAQF